MTTTQTTCQTCGGAIARAPTGRPARYCGDNCRVAAHRERARQAEAERLAEEERQRQAACRQEARRRAARLRSPLEDAAAGAREAIGALITAAGSSAAPADVAEAAALWRQAAVTLTAIAGDYTTAVTQAAG